MRASALRAGDTLRYSDCDLIYMGKKGKYLCWIRHYPDNLTCQSEGQVDRFTPCLFEQELERSIALHRNGSVIWPPSGGGQE